MPKSFALVIFFWFACNNLAFSATKAEIVYEGKHVSIYLPANPTTGYQWQIRSFNKKAVNPLKPRFIAPKTKLAGAPGMMMFPFSLLKTNGFTRVCFQYQRSWEKEPIETYCANIKMGA